MTQCGISFPEKAQFSQLNVTFVFNVSKYVLEPQLCKSEQRPSSLPVGPVVAALGNQTPTPNSTGTALCKWLMCTEKKAEYMLSVVHFAIKVTLHRPTIKEDLKLLVML